MNTDLHIHSKYSYDSKTKIKDIITEAEAKGLKCIGIVDHVEFSYQSLNEIIHRIKSRNSKIDELASETDIKILKGIEVSEPHKYPEEMKYIDDIEDIDYTLGAIHHILGVPIKKISYIDTINEIYLNALLEMINNSNINAVAHLDLLKKYLKTNPFSTKDIEIILRAMISNNILLEVNSNAYDVLGDYSPSYDIINIYKQLGGKNIITGSDAHKKEDIYRYLDFFDDNGLNECIIENRKTKKLSIR